MGKDRKNQNSRHNLKKNAREAKYNGLKNTNSIVPKAAKQQLKKHRKMQQNLYNLWQNIRTYPVL